MKVLFVSPEVGPIVRAGGLGDVVGALPLALGQLGIDVRVLCPLHRECADLNAETLPGSIKLKLGSTRFACRLQESKLGNSNITVYLLEKKFEEF